MLLDQSQLPDLDCWLLTFHFLIMKLPPDTLLMFPGTFQSGPLFSGHTSSGFFVCFTLFVTFTNSVISSNFLNCVIKLLVSKIKITPCLRWSYSKYLLNLKLITLKIILNLKLLLVSGWFWLLFWSYLVPSFGGFHWSTSDFPTVAPILIH